MTSSSVLDQLLAARNRLHKDRAGSLALFDTLFAQGATPPPPLDGRYAGVFLGATVFAPLDWYIRVVVQPRMPWMGKVFYAATNTGENVFSKGAQPWFRLTWPLYRGYISDTPKTFRVFRFRTLVGPGVLDPQCHVLKIDYDLPENPRWSIRRVLDELVQVDEGVYLGKAHYRRFRGGYRTAAYFAMLAGDKPTTASVKPSR